MKKKMILTNENNIDTTFTEVDIIESFDDIILHTPTLKPTQTPTLKPTQTQTPKPTQTQTPTTTVFIFNEFPSPPNTWIHGVKIYTDNTQQSKANNIELYNNGQEYRNNSDDDPPRMVVKVLVIDNKTIYEYDGFVEYHVAVYNDSITLLNRYDSEVLTISSDGSAQFLFNKFPSNTSDNTPSIKIYTNNSDQSKSNNIEIYNDAIRWRSNYISNNRLSDTGQGISMNIDQLIMDDKIMDKYDGNYQYYINIYNNRIILIIRMKDGPMKGDLEILTISSDGSVQFLFNEFPSPTKTNIITIMPGLKIYTDNTDQSKSNNIELYNNAQEWRKDFLLNFYGSDNGQSFKMQVDSLILDNKIIDKYDGKYQ